MPQSVLVSVVSVLVFVDPLTLVHPHDQTSNLLALLSHPLPRKPVGQTQREVEVHDGILQSQSEVSGRGQEAGGRREGGGRGPDFLISV